MIIIDFSQTILAAIFANKDNIGKPIDKELLRHTAINSILSIKKKHSKQFGELVLSCDSKYNWRKEQFQYYKAKRSKDKEKDKEKWTNIFKNIEDIKAELKENLPYKLIEVDFCESDDIIGVLSKWSQTNDLEDTGLVSGPKSLLIVSTDTDFFQLQKYKNVKQYNNIKKQFLVCDDPIKYLKEHIITGDTGDGVPNVLSPDNSFVDEIRQKSIFKDKLALWLDGDLPDDENFRKNYERNETLVSLDKIPENIKKSIIEKFESLTVQPRSKLFNYFVKHNLRQHLSNIQEF